MSTNAWTEEDQKAAEHEGWFISDSDGSDNGPWQLQHIDGPEYAREAGYTGPPWLRDEDVWLAVRARTTPLHERAISFLREANPQEYEAIYAWMPAWVPEPSQEDRALWRCERCNAYHIGGFDITDTDDGKIRAVCGAEWDANSGPGSELFPTWVQAVR